MKNNENIGLQKLKDAFKEVNSEELDNLNIPNEEFEFSERYKKKMSRLLAKQKKPYWKYFNTAGKRVAAGILVFFMLFASSMTISAVREPVVEFVVSVYEKFVEIFFGEEDVAKAPDAIETVYTLGYLPDGYELECREVIGDCGRTVFVNEQNKIRLTQYTLQNKVLMDKEDADFEIILNDNTQVLIVTKFGDKALYWNSNEYAFKMVVPPEFSQEECVKMIESLQQIE